MTKSHDNKCPTGAFRLVELRQRDPATKLGFSLRGGKEATGSSVGVFVSHIEPLGQASQIGLRIGDQLIQVNGLQVSQATYDEVIELIKQTPKCDHIRLLVNYVGRIPFQERAGDPIGWLQVDQENYSDQNEMNANYSIGESNQSSEGSLSNLTKSDDQGQDVASSLSPRLDDGIPELTGNGYQVGVAETRNSSSISNQDKSYSSSSSAVSSCFSSRREGEEYDDEAEEDDVVLTEMLAGSSNASTSSGCSISMSSVQSGHSSASSQTNESVTITNTISKTNAVDLDENQDETQSGTPVRVPGGRRTSEPFGCGVVKGPDEWPGIFVQNVKRDSLAERVGLQPGDQLLEAEGHELTEMAFEEAINLIKRLQSQQDELLLLVRKGAALRHLAKCKQHSNHSNGARPSEALNKDAGKREDNNQVEDLKRATTAAAAAAAANRPSERQPAVECNRQPPQPLRPTVRRRPLGAPPAPPTRRNQQASDDTRPPLVVVVGVERDQIGSDKLEHSKRLVNGQSVASSAPSATNSAGGGGGRICANSISAAPVEETNKRQQEAAAAKTAAAENKNNKSETTTTIISEPMARRPADRAANKRRSARAEEATAAQVKANELRSLQRTSAAGSVEHSDELLRAPKATGRFERPNSNSSPPPPATADDGHEDGAPTAPSAGRQRPTAPTGRKEAPSLELDDLESESDANHRAGQLASRCDHNSSQQQRRQQLDEKGEKVTNSQRVLKTNGMGQSYRHCDDDELELERNFREQEEEEIRIVKQNCKLHHNSAQSLARSRMFPQQPVDCQHHNQFVGNQKRAMLPRIDLTLAPQSAKSPAKRTPKTTLLASSSNQLQRHVSVDNLNLMNAYAANSALNFQMRRGNDEPICSGQLADLRHHQELLFARQTRPSSVLGQAAAAAATPLARVNSPLVCCGAFNQSHNPKHHRRASSQVRHNDDELVQRQRSQECCLMAAACQKPSLGLSAASYQTTPPIGPMPIRPTTMKHLRAVAATGVSGGKLLKQQSCNTLALAKFKARSEDRLNLMNINLNYVQINPTASAQLQQQQSTIGPSELHLLRLQQARHQKQQTRILNSTRQVDWRPSRQPINANDLAPPTCCLQQIHLTNHLIKQSHCAPGAQAPHQQVFNYATASGMISQTRKVSPLTRSCCAMGRFQMDQLETSDQTLALARPNQKQRKMKFLAPMLSPGASLASGCYAQACCCCPREQKHNLHATETAKPTNGCAGGGGGASTDSSGYQSSSENAARRQNGGVLANNDHLKRPSETGDCCRPQRISAEVGGALNQTRRLSTFGGAVAAVQPRPTAAVRTKSEPSPSAQLQAQQSPVIEIGSCGVSTISSVTVTSSTSSLSPFSCSPLSSPGQRYLSSSSSSNSSHVDLAATSGGGAQTSEPTAAPAAKSKTRLFKRRGDGTQPGASSDQSQKSIPRPPPMPLDDFTLKPARNRVDSTQGNNARSCQQQQQPAHFSKQKSSAGPSGASSKVPTKLANANSEQISNKLCFVDELKMLADQQQKGAQKVNQSAHLEQSPCQRQGDSATLIKLINANKAAAGSSGGRRGPVECSCCQAGDCSLGSTTGQQQQPPSNCRKFGCTRSKAATRTAKGAANCNDSQPSKSVQLRDEEDNKRRQHELLMEEFKTAHSKMFNRLRKANGNNEDRNVTNDQKHDDDDEEEELPAQRTGQHNEQLTETKSSAATNKILDGGANLAVIRPRPTIATN